MSPASSALPSADLAPTGRAKCIHCTQPIAKQTVRIAVPREIDTGSFVTTGPGYLHPSCAEAWAESGWEPGFADLVAQVRDHSALPSLPAPFGTADAGTAPAPAAAVPPATPEAPPFGSLTSKQVAALAAKLAALKDEYKADSALEKAGVDWGQRDALRWHLAQHGLLEPTHPTLLGRLGESVANAQAEAVFAVLPRLGKPTHASTVVLPGWSIAADAMVLRAMQLDPARLESLLADAGPLLRFGIQLVRGRCGAELSSEDRSQVVDGLAACEVTGYGLPRSYSAAGERLVLATLGPSGWVRDAYATGGELAAHFGTAEQWQSALAKHVVAAKFSSIARAHDGLVALPLDTLVKTLGKPHFSSSDESHHRALEALFAARSDDPHALAAAAQTLDREASPGSYMREHLLLLALGNMAARGLPVPDGLELTLKWEGFSYCVAPWRGSAVMRATYQRALSALSAARVRGIVRKLFLRDYCWNYACALLSVAFDESLVATCLGRARDGSSLDPNAIGPLGAPVIPLLQSLIAAEDSATPTDATAQKERATRVKGLSRCLRAALGFLGATGQTFAESADHWLAVAEDDDYWSEEERSVFFHMLQGMTESRRASALLSLLTATKHIERAFFGVQLVSDATFRQRAARLLVQKYATVRDRNLLQRGLSALGKGGLQDFRDALIEEKPDAKLFEELANVFGHEPVKALREQANVKTETKLQRLLRLAAAASGPKERVYLLERPDEDRDEAEDEDTDEDGDEVPPTRTGSFSVSRGKGPGIVTAVTPASEVAKGKRRRKRGSDSEEEHILTIDLKEVPDLAERYPGVRALSLLARDPQHGDAWDSARLVAVPEAATPPTDGDPITVLPIEVPCAIFHAHRTDKDPQLAEIKSLLFNRPGYVLGEPIYIQGEDEGDAYRGFVMQLSERIADLNLGDCGSLYVFEDGAFMQCY